MMRMTKTVRGHYFITPKTEEESDLVRRWYAALEGFRLPDLLQKMAEHITQEGIKGVTGFCIDENIEYNKRNGRVREAPEGSVCFVPFIIEEIRLYRAWAAAFNAFMEEWERGDDEDEIASYYTNADPLDDNGA